MYMKYIYIYVHTGSLGFRLYLGIRVLGLRFLGLSSYSCPTPTLRNLHGTFPKWGNPNIDPKIL